MDPHASLTVVILSAMGLCSCQHVIHLDGPLTRAVGENVVFKLITPPSTPPRSISWTYESSQIVISLGDTQDPGPAYEGRISLNTSTASLELQNLSLNDNGEYTVRITVDDTVREGKTTLTVLERIYGANITHPDEVLIAGRSSVSLTCNAAQGSSITKEWTKDGIPLSPSNRVTISEDNATVSVSPVEKDDRGEYKCRLSNSISTAEATVMLIVNYGPEMPHIEGEGVIEIGSPINLTCTAESIPESSYTWTFKEKETSGASYSKDQSESEDSGNYICTASNNITGKTNTAVFELSVEGKGRDGLSTGAIVGIVIAVIIILLSVIGLTLFLLKKKGKMGSRKHQHNETLSEIFPPAHPESNHSGGNPVYVNIMGNKSRPSHVAPVNQPQTGPDAHVYETPMPANSFLPAAPAEQVYENPIEKSK